MLCHAGGGREFLMHVCVGIVDLLYLNYLCYTKYFILFHKPVQFLKNNTLLINVAKKHSKKVLREK